MGSLAEKFYLPENVLAEIKERIEKNGGKRGIKAVQKCLSTGKQGLVILADDITPFNLASHIPGLCKEKQVPLLYLHSRFDITTVQEKPVTCLFFPKSEIDTSPGLSNLLNNKDSSIKA